MKAIVTVKLKKNPNHNPHDKLLSICPISDLSCTDSTGEHHSYIEEGKDLDEIRKIAKTKYYHITRIEEIK